MNPHSNATVPNNGSSVTCASVTYTPVSALRTLDITFVGSWMIVGLLNGFRQWYCKLMVSGVEIGTLKHGTNHTQETDDSSPMFGQRVNSSTPALTITVQAHRHFATNQTFQFVDHGGNSKTAWFHVEEAQR